MTRTFEISWNDFTSDAQDTILDSCIERLTDAYQSEGEEYLKREWHDPKPQSWQEAYCRTFATEWELWTDYEKGKEDAEVPKLEDWKEWIDEEIREKAEQACYKSMHHLEIEVEL